MERYLIHAFEYFNINLFKMEFMGYDFNINGDRKEMAVGENPEASFHTHRLYMVIIKDIVNLPKEIFTNIIPF